MLRPSGGLAPFQSAERVIAVGTVIADRPPHRSVRAALPHTALTSDVDMHTAHWDKDAESWASEASGCSAWRTFPRSCGGRVGCDDAACGATSPEQRHGIVAGVHNCQGQRSTDTSHDTRFATNRRSTRGRHGGAVTACSSRPRVSLGTSFSTSFGWMVNSPRRVFPLICVKPRKSKVSGGPCPRFARRSSA